MPVFLALTHSNTKSFCTLCNSGVRYGAGKNSGQIPTPYRAQYCMSLSLTARRSQELPVPHHIRQPEISDLEVVVLVQEQVLRFQVAVVSQSRNVGARSGAGKSRVRYQRLTGKGESTDVGDGEGWPTGDRSPDAKGCESKKVWLVAGPLASRPDTQCRKAHSTNTVQNCRCRAKSVVPVYYVVEVAVLHCGDDLLEQTLRLLCCRPPFGHDVVEQLSVRRVLLQQQAAYACTRQQGRSV